MNADGDILSGSTHSSGGFIQEDGWMFALNGGYESPLGDVKQSYGGSPTLGINVLRRKEGLLYSATLDYRSYKPLQDSLPVTYDGTKFYNAKFSNYRGIGFYLGVAYELPLAGGMSVYAGVNGGTMLISYKITVDDPNYSSTEQYSNAQSTYIGPKLGLNFLLSPNLGLMLEGRYSLGVIGGSYNSREGGSVTKGFNSYAGNVFLTYKF
ncbi:hypothetical protein BH09BAC6_BH09BAC6_27830 [soil metagenome]|jgi:hypothetical protein